MPRRRACGWYCAAAPAFPAGRRRTPKPSPMRAARRCSASRSVESPRRTRSRSSPARARRSREHRRSRWWSAPRGRSSPRYSRATWRCGPARADPSRCWSPYGIPWGTPCRARRSRCDRTALTWEWRPRPAPLTRSGGPRSASSGPRCGAEGSSRSAFEASRSDRWTWFGPTWWRPRLRASSPARDNARTRLSEPLVFPVRSNLGRPLVGKVVTFRAVNADVETDSVATDSTGIARVDVTLGNQTGPALVTATVDSLERQAALSVEPGPPTGVILERDGTRVDAGTMTVPVGRTFVVRVSAQDAYGNTVPMANLARLIQNVRTRFNLKSTLLRVVSVESDGGAATVTFRPEGVGQADLTIAGATVSVKIVQAR